MLKRLADALATATAILAVIRGSAVNQDGASNGLTAPNGAAQVAVIRAALDERGSRPAEVGYVEAHGTGTRAGRPDRVRGVARPCSPTARPALPLVGSVKTNIGHLESAAGIAGLIKAVLQLHHGAIPPHLHLRQLNPHIGLDGTRFAIPTTPQAVAAPARAAGWPASARSGSAARTRMSSWRRPRPSPLPGSN